MAMGEEQKDRAIGYGQCGGHDLTDLPGLLVTRAGIHHQNGLGADTMKQLDETMLGLARIGKISAIGFPAPLPGVGIQQHSASSAADPPAADVTRRR